jgi:hypothetical protein
MISYFRREIDSNDQIENILTKNIDKCQQTLIMGINKIKDNLK